MDRSMDIREGMRVYGENDRALGTVERLHGDGFHVAGRHYRRDQVARVTRDGIYLRGAGATEGTARSTTGQAGGETRVPVAEERLTVGKRERELGEVDIRKTVTEEERTADVTLRRDEVRVEEVDVAERPPRAGEDVFDEGTIRVPVRGEEAVVGKEAIVTGEVVIDKESTTRQEQVRGTARKQHVDVEQAYREARGGFERLHGQARASQGRTFEQAEPHYRSGFTAAHDERYAGREFEDAEPELRQTHGAGDNWEQLRQEVREGWNRARGR